MAICGVWYRHTHIHTIYGSLDVFRNNLGELVPEGTFSHSHLSWSIIPYLLPPSVTFHGILPIQFTCLTVLFNNQKVFLAPSLGLATSTSYFIYFFTQSLSSFCSTCPYHHNLFCCSTEIMSSNPSLSLSSLLGTLSCSLMPHTSI